jgi:hypothetical protein
VDDNIKYNQNKIKYLKNLLLKIKYFLLLIILIKKIKQAIDKNKSGRNGPVIRRTGIAITIYSK